MKVEVYFTVPEVEGVALGDATVVVIDVLRATTTIVEALAAGAREIIPTSSTEEAVRLATSLGRDQTLLCGERRGLKVEGFDLGNSPREFTEEFVGGKKLVMSTTNGTRAFLAGQEAARLLPCAFTNLGAVAAAVEGAERLVVICAGRADRFSLEDALCAGHLVQAVARDASGEVALDDGALAARALAGARKPSKRFLARTVGGRGLMEIGLEEDLAICAQVDRHDVLAEMTDQAIRRAAP